MEEPEPVEKSIDDLLRDLDSPDLEVQLSAAQELGRRRDGRAVGPLIRLLQRSAGPSLWNAESEARARTAGAALRELGAGWVDDMRAVAQDGGAPAVGRSLRGGLLNLAIRGVAYAHPDVRRSLVEEWLRHTPAGAADLLKWIAETPGPERLRIAEALGRMGGVEIEAGLRVLYLRDDGTQDLAGAVGLAHLGDAGVLPTLVAALGSEEPRVVQATCDALAALGAQAATALARLYEVAALPWDSGTRASLRWAIKSIETAVRQGPTELEAAGAPAGRGTEPEASPPPEGRGTEPEAVDEV